MQTNSSSTTAEIGAITADLETAAGELEGAGEMIRALIGAIEGGADRPPDDLALAEIRAGIDGEEPRDNIVTRAALIRDDLETVYLRAEELCGGEGDRA